MSFITLHTSQQPKEGETVSGDLAVTKEFNKSVFVAVLDVAGHGPEANALALKCKAYLEANFEQDLTETIHGLHYLLKSAPGFKRGAAAALCRFNKMTGEVELAAVGDLSIRRFGSINSHILSHPGVVGYQMRSMQIQKFVLNPADFLIIHTDGIKSNFDPADLPECGVVRAIANHLITKHKKPEDDALCVVIKYHL